MTTRGRRGRRTPRLVVALVLLAAAPAAADCVFVNTNSGANSVAAFAVAPDGTLLPVAGSPYPTGGLGGFTAAIGSLGLAVGGDFLYATNPGSGGLAGFRVLAGCRLLPLPGSPFPAGVVPVGVAADPAAGRLYVTDFAAETVAVYTIASDGTPTPIPGSPFAAPSTPLDLAFSRDGRLYLGQSTVSEVGGYEVLPDGAISPLATSPYLAAGFLQGLDLTPDGAYLYVAGRGLAGVVSGFEVLPSGALFPLAGSPFPADDPLDVLADPLGDLLYVSNNLGGTIAVFAI
ncbi:MAG TPA: beta-propeller fold lactonase family protein, partial [Thermoanaerobaculia bacterium]